MKRMKESSNGGGWVYTDLNLGSKMEILVELGFFRERDRYRMAETTGSGRANE